MALKQRKLQGNANTERLKEDVRGRKRSADDSLKNNVK